MMTSGKGRYALPGRKGEDGMHNALQKSWSMHLTMDGVVHRAFGNVESLDSITTDVRPALSGATWTK